MSRSFELLSEACAALAHTPRKMFGGHGFFAPNGGMFAGIVTDDEVMLKLQHGPARDELLALGGHPWQWDGGPKPTVMQEWIIIPESFYDDPETFAAWATRAHQLVPAKVAKAKGKPKAKAKPKPKPEVKPKAKAAAKPKKKAPARSRRTRS